MEKIIKNLINHIKCDLIYDMDNSADKVQIIKLILGAYNRYQEDECDGVGYLFDINNAEDLKCCICGGMTTSEISWVFLESQKTAKSTPYFLFGQNHKQPSIIETWDSLGIFLENFLDRVLLYMLAHHDADGYKQLYEHCISDYMFNNNMI